MFFCAQVIDCVTVCVYVFLGVTEYMIESMNECIYACVSEFTYMNEGLFVCDCISKWCLRE